MPNAGSKPVCKLSSGAGPRPNSLPWQVGDFPQYTCGQWSKTPYTKPGSSVVRTLHTIPDLYCPLIRSFAPNHVTESGLLLENFKPQARLSAEKAYCCTWLEVRACPCPRGLSCVPLCTACKASVVFTLWFEGRTPRTEGIWGHRLSNTNHVSGDLNPEAG